MCEESTGFLYTGSHSLLHNLICIRNLWPALAYVWVWCLSCISTHSIPTHTTINALLFLEEVWKHHGTPQVVVSDRGPQFVTGFTRKLYKLLGIKLAMSMAYHPQTNSQMEHINQVLEGYLRIFTSRRQDNWNDLLLQGEFHYNNSKHSSTQQTPFMVDTGRHPRMGFEPQQPCSTL
jgi:transposase InsO family protein